MAFYNYSFRNIFDFFLSDMYIDLYKSKTDVWILKK